MIEVSFMKRQRSWYLWLSREDHLPRKLTEILRVRKDLVHHEEWLDVTVGAEIPAREIRLDAAGRMAAVGKAGSGQHSAGTGAGSA